MSDIDSDDYVDVGENVLADDCNYNVDAVVTEKSGGKGRGRDIEWIEVCCFFVLFPRKIMNNTTVYIIIIFQHLS